MRRPRPRRKTSAGRRTQARVIGAALIAVALLALGAVGWVFISAKESHVDLDPESLCPKGRPTGIAAIIIDTTDSLSPIQRKDLANQLSGLRAELPIGWRVSVYRLEEAVPDVPEPALPPVCNPGRGEGLSELTSNPKLVEKRWQERFDKPIGEIVDELTQEGEGKASPIMEMIQAVSVGELSAPNVQALPRTIILASDMLQHSDHFSMYRSKLAFEGFRASPAYTALQADLRGVHVQILYVARAGQEQLQGTAHVHFWEQYFDAQGATLDRVKRITGE
jgi:hypothetical protein